MANSIQSCASSASDEEETKNASIAGKAVRFNARDVRLCVKYPKKKPREGLPFFFIRADLREGFHFGLESLPFYVLPSDGATRDMWGE